MLFKKYTDKFIRFLPPISNISFSIDVLFRY